MGQEHLAVGGKSRAGKEAGAAIAFVVGERIQEGVFVSGGGALFAGRQVIDIAHYFTAHGEARFGFAEFVVHEPGGVEFFEAGGVAGGGGQQGGDNPLVTAMVRKEPDDGFFVGAVDFESQALVLGGAEFYPGIMEEEADGAFGYGVGRWGAWRTGRSGRAKGAFAVGLLDAGDDAANQRNEEEEEDGEDGCGEKNEESGRPELHIVEDECGEQGDGTADGGEDETEPFDSSAHRAFPDASPFSGAEFALGDFLAIPVIAVLDFNFARCRPIVIASPFAMTFERIAGEAAMLVSGGMALLVIEEVGRGYRGSGEEL
ncbi:MAG: hypothetical protein NTW86_25500 [Candidatus Sumerlaeota bacterium]|nr:hypothetical protein [Candidatus Sumerlaeota bacterium]